MLSLPPQPGRAERLGNRAIDVEGARVIEPGYHECAIAVTPFPLLPRPPPAATPQSGPSLSDASTAMAAATTVTFTMVGNKQKSWNHAYYAKKKLRLLDFEATTDTTAIADTTAVATTVNSTAVATVDSAAAVAVITGGL